MTKSEFLQKMPSSISHKTWGWGELEIIVDKQGQKGICYRHEDKTASYGTYGSNWEEVLQEFNSKHKE